MIQVQFRQRRLNGFGKVLVEPILKMCIGDANKEPVVFWILLLKGSRFEPYIEVLIGDPLFNPRKNIIPIGPWRTFEFASRV